MGLEEPSHWHAAHAENSSFGDWVADAVARLIGSWAFVIGQSVLMAVWIFVNSLSALRIVQFDEFPFVFLNLFMSAEAAFATPLILMSQNRQADRDRHQADFDLETNLAAKEEIEQLQRHLARLELDKLDLIIRHLGIETVRASGADRA